jgi:DNA-binding MarR family transcriptional regulator
VVQRLEARRLIRRIQHANDGRRVHLRVTPAGARLNVPHAPGTVEAAVRRTLSKTRIEDRDATVKVLERLAANLVGRADGALIAPLPVSPCEITSTVRK